MKRFAKLLVVAFCTAIMQVQPVQPLLAKQADECSCCKDGANACGMPDCAPMPACAPASAVLASEVSTLRSEAENALPKARNVRDAFRDQFSPRPAVPAEIAPRIAAPVASVPVFQVHCSFLI